MLLFSGKAYFYFQEKLTRATQQSTGPECHQGCTRNNRMRPNMPVEKQNPAQNTELTSKRR